MAQQDKQLFLVDLCARLPYGVKGRVYAECSNGEYDMDGDILVDKYNNVGIYKEIEGVYWDSYIYLGCDGIIRGFSIGGRHEQTGTHPATKEQCDLLFAKMKEASLERIVKIKN